MIRVLDAQLRSLHAATICVLLVIVTAMCMGWREVLLVGLTAVAVVAVAAVAAYRDPAVVGGAEAVEFSWNCLGSDIYNYFETAPVYRFANFRAVRSGTAVHLALHTQTDEPTFGCTATGCPSWIDIHCSDEQQFGSLIVKTSCHPPWGEYPERDKYRGRKVFVRGFRDFAAYTAAIKSGRISRADNDRLWTLLKDNWDAVGSDKFDLVNHNLDVDTLHFKYSRC
jgi:hypothetical protein